MATYVLVTRPPATPAWLLAKLPLGLVLFIATAVGHCYRALRPKASPGYAHLAFVWFIEIFQLILVLTAGYNSYAYITAIQELRWLLSLETSDLIIACVVTCTGFLTINTIAVFLVDMASANIIPRSWKEMKYLRPLLQTRQLLLPWTVKERDFPALSRRYRRAMSEPTTPPPKREAGWDGRFLLAPMIKPRPVRIMTTSPVTAAPGDSRVAIPGYTSPVAVEGSRSPRSMAKSEILSVSPPSAMSKPIVLEPGHRPLTPPSTKEKHVPMRREVKCLRRRCQRSEGRAEAARGREMEKRWVRGDNQGSKVGDGVSISAWRPSQK